MDPEFVHQLRCLLLQHAPAGIALHALPAAWQAKHSTPLNPQRFGYSNLHQLLQDCPQACMLQPSYGGTLVALPVLSLQGMEALAQHCILHTLAQGGVHLSYELVAGRLASYLADRPPEFYGQALPPSLERLRALDRRLAVAISAYCGARCVWTLWELEQHLCCQEGVQAYTQLGLGPLAAHPHVAALLGPTPPHASLVHWGVTPRVEVADVVEALRELMLGPGGDPGGGVVVSHPHHTAVVRQVARRVLRAHQQQQAKDKGLLHGRDWVQLLADALSRDDMQHHGLALGVGGAQGQQHQQQQQLLQGLEVPSALCICISDLEPYCDAVRAAIEAEHQQLQRVAAGRALASAPASSADDSSDEDGKPSAPPAAKKPATGKQKGALARVRSGPEHGGGGGGSSTSDCSDGEGPPARPRMPAAQARKPPQQQKWRRPDQPEVLNRAGVSLEGLSKEERQAIAEANGLPPNFTFDSLLEHFLKLASSLLGGALVPPSPDFSFYQLVAVTMARHYAAPQLEGYHRAIALQAKGKKARKKANSAAAQAASVAATHFRGHLVLQMLLRGLHAAMQGRLPVCQQQKAAVSDALAAGLLQEKKFGVALAARRAAGDASSDGSDDDDGDAPYIGGAEVRKAFRHKAQLTGPQQQQQQQQQGKQGKGQKQGSAPQQQHAAGAQQGPLGEQAAGAGGKQAASNADQDAAAGAPRHAGSPLAAEKALPEPKLCAVASAIGLLEATLAELKPASGWDVHVLQRLRAGLQAMDCTRSLRSLITFVNFALAPDKPLPAASDNEQPHQHQQDPDPQEQEAARGELQPKGGNAVAPAAATAAVPPQPPPRPPVEPAALCRAVLELSRGCSIPAIAALERAVTLRLATAQAGGSTSSSNSGATGGAATASATAFHQLGVGPSLACWLAEDDELLLAMAGGREGNCRAPREEVLEVCALAVCSWRMGAAAAVQPTPEAQAAGTDTPTPAAIGPGNTDTDAHAPLAADAVAAVEQALCLHYGVPRAECLGHGSAASLAADAQQQRVAPSAGVRSAAALAAGAAAAAGGTQGSASLPRQRPQQAVGALGDVGREAALCALRAAPPLADLALASQWGAVFEAELGPLEAFLRREGAAAGVAALEVPPCGGAALSLVAGQVVKVPHSSSVADVVARATAGDARGCAAAVLSLVAAGGGVAGAPLRLLADHLGDAMAALEGQAALAAGCVAAGGSLQEAGGGASREAGPSTYSSGGAAARFALSLACHLPLPLMAPLAEAILLPPLERLMGGPSAAHAALLRAAAPGSLARSCLHHLGMALGVQEWRDDWVRQAGLRAIIGTADEDGTSAWGGAKAPCETLPGNALATNSASQDMDLDLDQTQKQATPAAPPANGGPAADGRSAVPAASGGRQAHAEGPPVDAAAADNAAAGAAAAVPDEAACRALVESIQRDEFGIGAQLDAEAAQLSGRLAARMGRALQRLAAELYSTDSHFVMELVQNADDNAYPAGVVPSLEFVILPDAVVVANNEMGFEPQHIRALCDVGASTKARVAGYIGQKGIGFKSVFRVSSAPEVHSRAFHVAFDLRRHAALGYCLPEWRELTRGSPARAALARLGCRSSGSSDPPHGTAIVLPLLEDLQLQGAATASERQAEAELLQGAGGAASVAGGLERGAALRRRFSDLSPTLLLFLQRLRRITVREEAGAPQGQHGQEQAGGGGEDGGSMLAAHTASIVTMERRPAGGHLVELLVMGPDVGAGRVSKWAVVASTLAPQLPRLGVAVSETRVALAFCLDAALAQAQAGQGLGASPAGAGGAAVAGGGRPPQQPVFAYLPLRSYGLRFIVQADWVVPTSREAVDGDSPWNQLLRTALPQLFLQALDAFRKLPPPVCLSVNPSAAQAAATTAAAAAAAGAGAVGDAAHACAAWWADQWLRCVPLEGEAQGFFAGLPGSIAAAMRACACIPTEDGGWARPADTAVCTSPEAMRPLLLLAADSSSAQGPSQGQQGQQQLGHSGGSGAPLAAALGARFVSRHCHALMESRPLRALLGVREFGDEQLLGVVKAMCRNGKLQQQGLPWLVRVLATLLDSAGIQGSAGGSGSAAGPGPARSAVGDDLLGSTARAGTGRAALLRDLSRLPLLPLLHGGWAAAAEGAAAAGHAAGLGLDPEPGAGVFFPLQHAMFAAAAAAGAQPPAAGAAGPGSAAGALTCSSSAQEVVALLAAAGLPPDHLSSVSARPAPALEAGRASSASGSLRLLDPALLDACCSVLARDAQASFLQGLQAMGVRQVTPQDVVRHVVLPALCGSPAAAACLPAPLLVSYLALPLLAGLAGPDASSASTAGTVVDAGSSGPAAPDFSSGAGATAARAPLGRQQPASGASTACVSSCSWLLPRLRDGMALATTRGTAWLRHREVAEYGSAAVPGAPSAPGGGASAPAASSSVRGRIVPYSEYAAWLHASGSSRRDVAVYLPGPLCPQGQADVASELGGTWTLLDGAYAAAFPGLAAQWRWLFSELGVHALPLPVRTRVLVRAADLVPPSPWAGCTLPPTPSAAAAAAQPTGQGQQQQDARQAGSCADGAWVVEDWSCPRLQRAVERAGSRGPAAMTRLAQLLSAHWSSYSSCMDAKCQPLEQAHAQQQQLQGQGLAARLGPPPSRGTEAEGAIDARSTTPPGTTATICSTFAHTLRTCAWLPCRPPSLDHPKAHRHQPHAGPSLTRPAEAFLPLPALRMLLQRCVPYVDLPQPMDPRMAAQLGVRSQASPELVLQLLAGWSKGAAATRGGAFCCCPSLPRGMYEYLQGQVQREREAMAGQGAEEQAAPAKEDVGLPDGEGRHQLGGAGGDCVGPVASAVRDAFGSSALLWLPGLLWFLEVEAGCGNKDDGRPCDGRFYRCEQVRLTDPAAVMELAAARLGLPLRSLAGSVYAGSQPCLELLRGLGCLPAPTIDDYLACLKGLAAAAAAGPNGGGSSPGAAGGSGGRAPSWSWAKPAALRILAHWGLQLAAAAGGGQEGVSAGQEPLLQRLKADLAAEALLPCSGGAWARLSPQLLINDDDPWVAHALPAAPRFAVLPGPAGAGPCSCHCPLGPGRLRPHRPLPGGAASSSSSSSSDGSSSWQQQASDVAGLLLALGASRLSRCVEWEVECVCVEGGEPLLGSTAEGAVRAALAAAQRYLPALFAEDLEGEREWRHVAGEAEAALARLEVRVVPRLVARLRIGAHMLLPAPVGAAGPSGADAALVEPAALCLCLPHGPLLCVRDAGGVQYTAVAAELSRLFNRGSPWPAMADRLLTALMASAAGQDLQALLHHQGVPPLPPGLRPWVLPAQRHVPPAAAAGAAAAGQDHHALPSHSAATLKRAREHVAYPNEQQQQQIPSGTRVENAMGYGASAAAAATTAEWPEEDAIGENGPARKRSRWEPSWPHMSTGPTGVEDQAAALLQPPQSLPAAGEAGGWFQGAAPPGAGPPHMALAATNVASAVMFEQQAAVRGAAERMQRASHWFAHSQMRQDPLRRQGVAPPPEHGLTAPLYGHPPGQPLEPPPQLPLVPVCTGPDAAMRDPRVTPRPPSDTSNSDLRAVGRWGEELVFRHLMQQLEQDGQRQRQANGSGAAYGPYGAGAGATGASASSVAQARVVWANRERETFAPYDLYVVHPDDSITYIEVKSSASRTKDLFELSLQELRFAEEQGARYELYRVRGAGSAQPSLVRLVDPARLIRDKAISLCIVL